MRVAIMVAVAAALGLAGVGGWYLHESNVAAAKISAQELQSALADGIKTAEAYIAWANKPTNPAVTINEVRLKRRKLAPALVHPDFRKDSATIDEVLAYAEKELDRIGTLPATAAESKNLRIGYARRVEVTLLAQGLDAHVDLSEPNKLGLIIRYIAMSRPLVQRFSTDESLRATLKSLGFTALTLTDGRNMWETFDL